MDGLHIDRKRGWDPRTTGGEQVTVIDLRDRPWRAKNLGRIHPPRDAGVRTRDPDRVLEAGVDLPAQPVSRTAKRHIAAGWWWTFPDVAASFLAGAVIIALETSARVAEFLVVSSGWFVLLIVSGGYSSRPSLSDRARLKPVGVAAMRALAAAAVAAAVLSEASVTRLVSSTAVLALCTGGVRLAVKARTRRNVRPVRLIARGSSEDLVQLLRLLDSDDASPYTIVAVQATGPYTPEIHADSGLVIIPSSVDAVEAVRRYRADGLLFVGQPASSNSIRQIAWQLEREGRGVFMIPIVAAISVPRISSFGSTGLPLVSFDARDLGSEIGFSKLILDKVAALLGLTALSPLMLVVAISVAMTSKGPVLFKQTRVGRDGSRFEMLKFRTMYEDAEARKAELAARNQHQGGTLFKIKDDPRVTPVGRVLRRYSLDEIPQLLNVLRGEMSLVGPRPPLPEEVANFDQDAHRRFRVRPGLTGLWQVSGRSDLDPARSAQLDTRYVEQWSISLDLQILMRTPRVVVTGEGAY